MLQGRSWNHESCRHVNVHLDVLGHLYLGNRLLWSQSIFAGECYARFIHFKDLVNVTRDSFISKITSGKLLQSEASKSFQFTAAYGTKNHLKWSVIILIWLTRVQLLINCYSPQFSWASSSPLGQSLWPLHCLCCSMHKLELPPQGNVPFGQLLWVWKPEAPARFICTFRWSVIKEVTELNNR